MKQLFILLLTLSVTQAHAAIPSITVRNATNAKIMFVVEHDKSFVCNIDRTPREVLVGETITFIPSCPPTRVSAIPQINGGYLSSNAIAPTAGIDVRNRKGDLAFEAKDNILSEL